MNFEYSVRCVGMPACVIVWPMYDFAENETEHLLEEMEKLGLKDFELVPVKVMDWDRDLSPWKAPSADGSGEFAGEGPDTLRWITDELMPELRKDFSEDILFYIAGYSLAGLFALWSMYESNVFHAAVCCSPSVWFEKWDRYTETEKVKGQNKYIYLSLGGKEEKTSNPVMAQVGNRIRRQEMLLKADPHVNWTLLEWNSGGHFADSGKRLAKGIAKLMKAMEN